MLEVCLLGIVIVGLISFKIRLDEFNQSYNTQKLAFETFNSCENGMTIEELNEKFGKKAYKCFGKSNKYRWHFGKGIIVRKNNNIVPYSEFSENIENPVYVDKVRLFSVELKKRKQLIAKECVSKLFADRIVLSYNGNLETINFSDIDGIACLGRNKLSIKFMGKIYQFKVEKFFNSLKYMNIFYKSKNQSEESVDGIFLGL